MSDICVTEWVWVSDKSACITSWQHLLQILARILVILSGILCGFWHSRTL